MSVIIAARNEALVIARTIEALRRSTHPGIELIVVDDGSDDGTADVVESFGPDIVVIRQPATGKPAALNRGVRAARHEFVVSIDADTLVEPTTVTELLRPFEDPEIGAVSGQVLIDRPTGLIGRFQRVEYAIGCNIERRMLNQLGFMTCVSGAVGAYRRHAVLEAGGFSDDTVAEDTDLALELQRWGWKVVYQPSARVFTTAPATVVALWHQRVRWSLGIMQSMWKHRRAIRGRSAGLNVGPRVLAYLFLFSGLALLGPLIDAVAISAILTAQVGHLLAFWAVLTAMTTGLAAAAFSIEDQPLRYALVTPLMTIIYRPVLYLAQVRALQIGSMGLRPRWNRARPVSAGVDEQDIDLRDSPKLCGADFVADFVADFGAVELSPAQQFVLAAEVYER